MKFEYWNLFDIWDLSLHILEIRGEVSWFRPRYSLAAISDHSRLKIPVLSALLPNCNETTHLALLFSPEIVTFCNTLLQNNPKKSEKTLKIGFTTIKIVCYKFGSVVELNWLNLIFRAVLQQTS